jgi:hypothetical protein
MPGQSSAVSCRGRLDDTGLDQQAHGSQHQWNAPGVVDT